MINRFDKKIVASCIAIAVLLFGIIAGTLAFLQDNTGVIENEFTYGDIEITLTEAVVDEYGVAAIPAARTDQNQEYKLIPGHSYVKDPTVTVTADSEAAFVYLLIDNPIASLEDSTAGTIASQMSTAGWSVLSTGTGEPVRVNGHSLSGTQTIYYKAVSSSSSDQDLTSFETLNIAADANVTSADSLSIDVTAYAVQQDGFNSAMDAWRATFGAGNGGGQGGQGGGQQSGLDQGIDNSGVAHFDLNRFSFTPDASTISWQNGAGSAVESVVVANGGLEVTVLEANRSDYGRTLTGTISDTSGTNSIVIRVHIDGPGGGGQGGGGQGGGQQGGLDSTTNSFGVAYFDANAFSFTPDVSTVTWNGSDGNAVENVTWTNDNNGAVEVTVASANRSDYGRTLTGTISDTSGENSETIRVHIEQQGGGGGETPSGPQSFDIYVTSSNRSATVGLNDMNITPDTNNIVFDLDPSYLQSVSIQNNDLVVTVSPEAIALEMISFQIFDTGGEDYAWIVVHMSA